MCKPVYTKPFSLLIAKKEGSELENLMIKVLGNNYQESELKSKRMSSITIQNCPFCDGRWKLNVNAEKGVYRCARCGESGNAIKLNAALNEITYKESKKQLYADKKPAKKIEMVGSKELPVASLERRDAIYRSIIKHGICSQEQADDLARRGLHTDQYRWYATVVSGLNDSFTTWCRGETHGLIENGKLRGIPGLYGKVEKVGTNGEVVDDIHLNLPKNIGYLIPVISHIGTKPAISCMQIRRLDSKSKVRYTFFTSGDDKLKNGSSVNECNKIHYTRNFWQDGKFVVPETVNLTEGALKADVASVLSGQPFIAILGVNNVRDLPQELQFLKAHGCKKINICFDMDYEKNKYVAKALSEIILIIKDSGLIPRKIVWNNQYKGIDDYLLSVSRGETVNKE